MTAEPFRSRDAGSATAEFAAVLPAVIGILLVCLTGLQLASTQIRLGTAAANAARSVARGESEALAAQGAARVVVGATLNVFRQDELVCVVVSRPPVGPIESIAGLTLSATSCTLADGN